MEKFASHIFGWAAVAFVANLAGTFALTEIIDRGSTNDPFAEEGILAGLLIFGTWTALAVLYILQLPIALALSKNLH
jgi:hypothetical protein